MSKITISIDGYGEIKVRLPKRLTRDSLSDTVADAVAKTITLVDARERRFHPAMGVRKLDS